MQILVLLKFLVPLTDKRQTTQSDFTTLKGQIGNEFLFLLQTAKPTRVPFNEKMHRFGHFFVNKRGTKDFIKTKCD